MSKDEVKELEETIEGFIGDFFSLFETDECETDYIKAYAQEIPKLIDAVKEVLPQIIVNEYKPFFAAFSDFCAKCNDDNILVDELENLVSSMELFGECVRDACVRTIDKLKICTCCGREVVYTPLPEQYKSINLKWGTYTAIDETLNKDEYSCPYCGATDRDRLIIEYLKEAELENSAEGTRLLQVAPSAAITAWIEYYCPQIQYDTTDLFMSGVTFKADITDMPQVENKTYDVIICSHVLEHVKDDRKALSELKRILKSDGKLIFLVPTDLGYDEIDEEWGLSEEESWRRFGQGDHCRKYGKKALVKRLEEQFTVNQIGKNALDETAFIQGGFSDTSVLYVLTKSDDVSLAMNKEWVVDEELCENGPLVSVLLPCYNHEKYVEEAILSVINQSYKNIEFLVADDCSPDNTASIMKKYSSHYTKEIYYTENKGGRDKELLEYATGKYVALMHSDDLWDKDKIAIQVAYMEKHEECGTCFSWCKIFDDDGNVSDSHLFIQPNRNSYQWMRYFWEKGNAICHPSILARTDIEKKKRRYGLSCRQLPDYFKWIERVEYTSIHIVPKVLVWMRKHGDNTSGSSKENNVRHGIESVTGWLMVIREMDDEFFREAFRDKLIHPEINTPEATKCEKYFLMLENDSMLMQNNALIYLHEIYCEVEQCLNEVFKYTYKDAAVSRVERGYGKVIISD